MLEKTTRINYLFDFYQTLLTPKQRNYMELYYLEDYSLGEISELSQVSRQAVYDNIKRTEKMLDSYEDKLNLFKKFESRLELFTKMELEMDKIGMTNETKNLINQLKEID